MERNYKFRLRFLLQDIDLNEGVFLIGRSPICNLTLKDPLVSRQHARITVASDCATLDDLGSRNGTLVNGEPVFENRRLWHSDTLRIGAHTLGFIRERHYPKQKKTLSERRPVCAECGGVTLNDLFECTHCSGPLVPDGVCRHCHSVLSPDARYCAKCGTPVGRDDSTIPVELGGERNGWTPDIIDGVIHKALKAGRLEQAVNLLDGRIEDFEKKSPHSDFNLNELETLTNFNINIASHLKEPNRLIWVIQCFLRAPIPMPATIVKNLENAADDWYDIRAELVNYLEKIKARTGRYAIDSESLERLREAIKD